ncbi:unnamed protein product, partial [Tetraodon nigroviridis]
MKSRGGKGPRGDIRRVSAEPSLVLSGQTVTLVCEAPHPSSRQTPEIHWLDPQGEKVKRGNGEVKVSGRHSGQWTCVVTLGQRTHRAHVSVTVVDLDSPPLQYTSKSSPLSIPCSIPAHVSWEQIKALGLQEGHWHFFPRSASDLLSSEAQRLFSLSLDPVAWQSDQTRGLSSSPDLKNRNLSLGRRKGDDGDRGDYVCSLKFDNGLTLSRTVRVDVLEIVSAPGTDLISGQQLNLSCSLGVPLTSDLRLRWIPPEGSSLQRPLSGRLAIPAVSAGDGGKWRCELRRNDTLLTYVSNIDKIIDEAPKDPTQDFKTQVAKLGYGLLSGEYSKPAPDPGEENDTSEPRGDQIGIAPRMFKALVGRGHPEFSTNRQQDAQEFLLHFINMVERNCRSGPNPTEAFRFLVEEKIVCQQSQKAKYTQRVDYIIQLPVPMDQATNAEELQEAERRREEGDPSAPTVRAQIPFAACMAALSEPEVLTDFWSSANHPVASFPDHLVIQIKKFTFGLDWVPKKLDVSIDVPDTLDLSALRATGQQPGEELLPEVAPPPLMTPDVEVKGILGSHGNEEDDSLYSPLLSPVLDDSTVCHLCEMGFPLEACRRAVYYTGNTGIDAATNWIMSHIDDPGETGKTVSWNVKNMSTIQPPCSLFASLSGADFAAPLVLPGCSSGAGTTPTESVSEEHLETIVSMGFTRDQATKALRATVGSKEIFGIAENLDLKSNVLQRAVDWIFSHMDDLECMDISEGGRSAAESESAREPPPGPRVRDGPGKYELFAFISHMGTSTMCGHYVCHIKKDQQWVIFNDQKVCASEKPPKDMGYLYFYRRVA